MPEVAFREVGHLRNMVAGVEAALREGRAATAPHAERLQQLQTHLTLLKANLAAVESAAKSLRPIANVAPQPLAPIARGASVSAPLALYRQEAAHTKGAFGEVSIAYHLGLQREVVLKRIPGYLSHSADQEAMVMQAFDKHPDPLGDRKHLATFIELMHQGDHVYVAMEKAPGVSLERRTLHPTDAVNATIIAARGLRHLHNAGFLHLDVKPANLMMVDGQPETLTVIDFGVSRKLQGQSFRGKMVGTPEYFAPEQDQGWANRSTDVYQLGLTLKKMLGEQAVLPGLSDVIAEATADKPGERYQSMDTLIAALQPFTR